MEITITEHIGFCFGVDRAIKTVYELIDSGKKVCTLGEIIHNTCVVNELKQRGVDAIHSFLEIPNRSTVVIRSHGISKDILEKIKNNNQEFVDSTCPFVKKIHRIVEKKSQNKQFLLVAGNVNHPEVIGIRSYFQGKSYVFSNLEELNAILSSEKNYTQDFEGIMVSQTTFSTKKWSECKKFISKSFTNIEIYDTICNMTSLRQYESEKLAKVSDLMIIIGDKKSSNTRKLYDICNVHTSSICIEDKSDIYNLDLNGYKKIGITSGASTPKKLVLEVKEYLEFQYNGSENV